MILTEIADYFSNVSTVQIMFSAIPLIIFNIRTVLNFVDGMKEKRVTKLTNVVKFVKTNDCEDKWPPKYLEDRVLEQHLSQFMGVNAELKKLTAMMRVHSNAEGHLALRHLKKANFYIRYRNGKLRVKIGIFDWIGFAFNTVFFLFMVVLAVALLIPSSLNEGNDLVLLLSRLIGGSFVLLFSIILANNALDVWSAHLVKREIAEQAHKENELLKEA